MHTRWFLLSGTHFLMMMIGTARAELVVRQVSEAEAAKTFGRIEFTIDPGQTYANPFDPDEISIDGHFTAADGKALVLPAFWYQQFDNDGKPRGIAGWLLRFAPPTSGAWKLQVVARDKSGDQ